MIQLLHHAPLPVVRIVHRLGEVVDRPGRHAGFIAQRQPVLAVCRAHQLFQQRLQRIDVLSPVAIGDESGIGGQIRPLQHVVAEPLPGALVGASQHHVAVANLDRLVRRGDPVPPSGRLRNAPFGEVGRRFPGEPGQAALGDRHIHQLPLPRLLLVNVGRQYRVDRGDSRADIVDRHAGLQRPPAGLAGHRHQAGHALGDQIEPALAPIRPRLAVAGDRAVDQAGIDALERLVVDLQRLGNAGPVVLDHHIRFPRQFIEERQPVGLLEIERDAALVAVDLREAGGLVVDVRPHLTTVVAALGLLDLDHVCTHVSQHHGAVWPGHDLRDIEYLHAFQR